MKNTLPLHSKDLLPETKRDLSLFIFMIGAILFFAVFELSIVLPKYHDEINLTVIFHVLIGIFITVNIFGNVYYLKRVDVTGKQFPLPAALLEGWTYCHICQMNAPPRAYHCTLCKECILKRDHHCMFSGCCVGYFNHRYYIVTLAYLLTGALYCVCYHWEYCLSHVNGSGWWSVLALLAPHFALLSGTLNLIGFAVISAHTFSIVTVIMTSYLLSQQIMGMINGQTMFEKKEAIFTYNLGFRDNFLQIFGSSWKNTFFFFWAESILPGDGISYQTASQRQEIKQL